MRLVELSIRRLPGITAPFSLGTDEIGTHVTLIHGPNATGKSSIVRALTALLWPELETSREIELSARLELDGRSYTVERHADNVVWRVDGERAAAPTLPPTHMVSCYAITGDELLGGGDAATLATKDGALAAEIARQMSGGFDLQRLRDAVESIARPGQIEARRLRDAEVSKSRTKEVHATLDVERAQLATLQERKRQAQLAAQTALRLETALQLDRARTTLGRLESGLGVFSPGMDQLRGDELDRLREIEKKLAVERREIDDANGESTRCRQAIERAALPADGIPSGALAEFRQRVDRIGRNEIELARLEREETIARTALEARRRTVPPGSTLRADAAALTRAEDRVRQADALLRRAEVVAREHAVAVGESESLTDARSSGDLRDNAEATRLLTEWLSTPEAQRRGFGVETWLLVAAAVAASIALGASVHAAWYALLGVPVLALVLRARARSPGRDRREFEASFARLKSAAPARWTRDAVLARLSELNNECAAIEAARLNEARVEILARRQKDLDAQTVDVDGERRRIAAELGLDVASSDLALTVLARSVLEYLKADVDHEKSRSSVAAYRTGHAAEVQRLVAAIAGFGVTSATDAAALSGALTTLSKRAEAHLTAHASLQNATVQRDRALQRSDVLEIERKALLASTGDEHELARKIGALAAWKTALRAVDDAQREQRALEQKLSDVPELMELSRADIVRELEEATRTASQRDEWIQQVQDIETRIRQTEQQHGLEEALASVQAAKDALHERREDALDDAATAWLLADVESAAQQTAQSPVFQRAAAAFARFTNHAFELQIAAGRPGRAPAFRALDTARGERLALHELSSGTRAQLLLAARIGFVSESERGVALPLFLDEALANSDPRRFEQIAKSLSVLAEEEGRQIFYLTSDPLDVERWQAAAPDTEFAVVDLELVRGTGSDLGVLTPLRPAARTVPSPSGMSAEQYARTLLVPAIDPFAAVESWHLYYALCDDLALLHRLVSLRIETVGGLRSFARSADSRAYASAEEVARVEAWATVYDSIVSAWRIGRGPPIGRDVLEAAGVSEKFLDDVCAIANEVGGDAKRLVQKLELRDDGRLKGWHEKKTVGVVEYLTGHGVLDTREPLDERELLARALLVASPAVAARTITGEQTVARTTWLLGLLDARLPANVDGMAGVDDPAGDRREGRVRV